MGEAVALGNGLGCNAGLGKRLSRRKIHIFLGAGWSGWVYDGPAVGEEMGLG